MNVSPDKPFQIIYSLFEHEYLGYLFESFVVQLNDLGKLTFSHQNISAQNACEFDSGLDEKDYELIKVMDQMQQKAVCRHFQKRKMKPDEFFLKVFDKQSGDKALQQEIERYMERRRSKILSLIQGKELYEMGGDGEPTWKHIRIAEDKATVLFHFRRNEENTHYFPTIKLRGEKIEFYQNNSYLLGLEPAWMVVDGELFTFQKSVNGKKLQPFFAKKFIIIPRSVEETYYSKFVAPLIASFDVYAKGFDIQTENYEVRPVLTFSELAEARQVAGSLFDQPPAEDTEKEKILFELSFRYGTYSFRADKISGVSVSVEKKGDQYTFHRISRQSSKEKSIIQALTKLGLPLRNSRQTMPKASALSWINENLPHLQEQKFIINQQTSGKRYFVGNSTMSLEISENIDWFDVKAIIRFGEYSVPFSTIRKHILKKKREFTLPNGEIAIIPDSWLTEYADLFAFANEEEETLRLNKVHVSLVKELKDGNRAKVAMTKKLEQLMDFDTIADAELPTAFKGSLRPYQQAGYNWLYFLNEYGFGGCLADDMGLGKTVQTLALLQKEKEAINSATNLLVLPTSLIYNWQMEAAKFAPSITILNYTGTNRNKNHEQFGNYDLVVTSYGIARVDVDILSQFFFNYVILDESQAIKNPDSLTSKSVRKLTSRRRLILSGTPIENSTMDLWSQMSFANPGLLGNEQYFKKRFQIPIEKKQSEETLMHLNALIKPFILRREKTQVAKELPEKVENIRYCNLSETQREYYEREKSAFRNEIMDLLEKDGLKESQMLLLQGLTRLRQVVNHPAMIDEGYEGDSGKFEDITYMIDNALGKNHKILIFSQFVKHLKIVENYLKSQKIAYSYLDGSVKDRQGQVDKFQNDDSIRIFLISLKAGGIGLNLTEADYVFLLDPWWNPAIEAQAVDRAHRIGQRNTVFSYKFIARDTIEEKILKMQESKLKLAKDLITVEGSFVKSLTKEDIANLFD